MFEALYEKLTDADRALYLERIGLADLELKGDLDTLNRVLYAHVQTVPFENLDAWAAGHCPSLAVRDLFNKVVVQRRGGWCHELNGLLLAFLDCLGYQVYPIAARVTAGLDFTAPVGHRAVICVLDGKKYYCDVGFGDLAFQNAIPLDGTPSAFGFHMEKNGDWYEIWRGGERPMKIITFPDVAWEPVDFLHANFASTKSPGQPFNSAPYISIMKDDRRILLQGTTLTVQTDGPKTVLAENLEGARLTAALKEYFGIDYEIPG